MKNTPLFVTIFLMLFAGIFLAGCMEFEYTGREFAPLTGVREPKYFQKKDDLPPGMYEIIGRAKITAPDSCDSEDIRIRLLKEAASRGADAVCLASVSRIQVGLYESDGQFSGPSEHSLNPGNLTPDGSPIRENMAGKTVELTAETHKAVKVVVRALFLKDREVLEKTIAERKKQLDRIIGKPSALPGREK